MSLRIQSWKRSGEPVGKGAKCSICIPTDIQKGFENNKTSHLDNNKKLSPVDTTQRGTVEQPTLDHCSWGQYPAISTTCDHICTDHAAQSPDAHLLLFIDAAI